MRLQFMSSRISFVCFLLGLAIALVAVLGVRLETFGLALGLKLMWPSIAFSAIALLSGAIWLFHALQINDSKFWQFGATGFFGALLILAPAADDGIRWLEYPDLVDITTDSGAPPPFVALLPLRAGADNGPDYDGARKMMYQGSETTALAVQKKAYSDLRPKAGLFPKADAPKTVMFWRAFETAKRMGWNIVAYDEKAGTIEATDSSLFFGMTDDIAIRVRSAGRIGARVDIRSKSRMRANDRGVNAARIKAFIQSIP